MTDFIIIDDDLINNIICFKLIRLTIAGAVVKTFTDPEKGLEYILSTYAGTDDRNAILFLDINMVLLNGWEVLDRLKSFSALVKERIKIFMLSSSVNSQDEEQAGNNALVSGYIIKPLSQAKLQTLFPDFVKSGEVYSGNVQ